MIVFLWTDILLWLLMLSSIFALYNLRNRPDFRIALVQLFDSKIAITSCLILLVYIFIGFLDSIHYVSKNNNDLMSVLDYFSQPWSDVSEKTFAEPFSSYLYAKERVIDANNTLIEVYPKLLHVAEFNFLILAKKIAIIFLLTTLFFACCYRFLSSYLTNRTKQIHHNLKFLIINIYIIFMFLFIIFSLYNHYHILGTDKIGTDVMYITLKSIRTGLIIGSLTTIFLLPFALFFGTAAGYYGGYVDDIIVYIYTTLSSIPGVLLISALILIIQTKIALNPDWFVTLAEQADIRLLALCVILGLTSWSGLCRLLRAETLKIKSLDYVTAAKTMRVNNFKIILRHIIPNLVHIIIINIAIDFSALVLAEAVLSYIGVGVDPTTMSWGNMINSSRLELSRDPIVWWPVLGAFIPMFIFVLALNLFADKIRDAFDPRLRVQ